MITFKNIAGNKFLAVGTIQRKSALNGEKSLTGTLYDGDDVLNKIDKGWSLEFDNEPYIVTYFERNDNDNSVSFDAIHKFFWDMAKNVLYSETSGSHTIKWYLDQIFANTGYSYALNFNPNAIAKDNWGMKNKLSLFNDVITSIEGEFEINGTLVSIFKNIGTDLSTIVRYGFNLSDMTIENDASGFVTYGEGFGAYADQENMTGDRLHVTYTSPLASVYGKLQAEPIDDQRYTIESNLLDAVKSQVDASFSISVNLSLYDLSVAGYPYKMANVGDWLTAVDENIDFKQRIRIISIDDEFAADGTRISYSVTAGDIGLTKKYQDANASIANKVEDAVISAGQAATDANIALIAANGKNKSYHLNDINDLPKTANEGDLAWVQSGDGRVLYIYTKKADGTYYWEKRIDPEIGEQIEAGVNEAIAQANENTATAIEQNNASQQEVMNDIAKSQADLAIKDGDFNNKAQAMADEALANAKANTAMVAKETLDTATDNLNTAKQSLTTDLQTEISDRTNAVAALDIKANGYADQAKQDAIDAATTADGTINKKIDDTATSLTSKIMQNKQDADGKITTAQSTATQALTGLSSKVDTSTYNAKTGQLSTDVTNVTQTANQAKTDIASIKQTNTSQDARMTTIESDASGTKTTVSAIQTAQGKQSGDISTLQQRADGFDATVTKVNNLSVGGRNYWSLANKIDGQLIYPDGSVASSASGLTAYNPNYFDVKQGQTIWVTIYNTDSTNNTTLAGRLVYYDSNKTLIPVNRDIGIAQGSYKNTAPTNAAYFRISLFKYTNIKVKVEIGNIPTDWTPAPEDVDSASAKAQLTADKASAAISKLTSADGIITKAQSDIQANADAISQKVSKTVYDKNTGDLTQAISKAQTTADGAVSTVGNYQTSNDGRVAAAESTIEQHTKDITARVIQTDYDDFKGSYKSKMSDIDLAFDRITSTVSETETTVNKLNQNNLVNNSQLNPDYSGWHVTSPWGKSVTNELTNNGVESSSGAMWVWHDQSKTGEWIYSDPINILQGLTLSASIMAAMPTPPSSGTPLALYVRTYDANKTIVDSWVLNITYNMVNGTFKKFSLDNKIVSSGAKYASVMFAWNVAGMISFGKPMLVFGETTGDYVAGPYNNNDKIASQQITIDGITSIVSDPNTGLSTRVQTAEGTLNTVKSTAEGAMSKASQTANDITQEISNRKTGDNNTLQSSKDFTTSSITSYDKGVQSQFTQTASGILAQVESTNMVVNSEFDPLNGTFYRLTDTGATGSQLAEAWNAPAAGSFTDWPVVNGSRVVTYAVGTWYTSALVSASGGKAFSASIVAGRSPAPTVSTALDYRIGFWDSSRKLITTASAGNIIDGTAYKGIQKYVVENKTAPANTAFVSVIIVHSSANVIDYITRPSLNMGAKASPYTPTYGTSSSSTVLSLFKDNWSIGITDNIGAITSGIVDNNNSMSLISKNVIIDSPSTQITGTAWINSAMIKDGSIGTAQIGDASITSAKIINLDVSRLTGNTTQFIKSNWDSAYSNVSIDPDSILLNAKSGSTTLTSVSIGSLGMKIEMPGMASFLSDTMINSGGIAFHHAGGTYGSFGMLGNGFTTQYSPTGGAPLGITIGDGRNNDAANMAFGISVSQYAGQAPQLIWAGANTGKVSSSYRTWDNPAGFIIADNIKFSTWDNTASIVEFDSTITYRNWAPDQTYGYIDGNGTKRWFKVSGYTLNGTNKLVGIFGGDGANGIAFDQTGDVWFSNKGNSYSLHDMLAKLNML
ncbi:phage tail protein [Leuconostoc mesenteroides]|uniref:phage tail protein n=1 Tax=Leuconostoc mesenteroides TaxID=1245 RepID=UPI00385B9885